MLNKFKYSNRLNPVEYLRHHDRDILFVAFGSSLMDEQSQLRAQLLLHPLNSKIINSQLFAISLFQEMRRVSYQKMRGVSYLASDPVF